MIRAILEKYKKPNTHPNKTLDIIEEGQFYCSSLTSILEHLFYSIQCEEMYKFYLWF